MDLQFPHHENEIAQNIGACSCQPVRYWMHGNMLLLNGHKMSKSEGYYIMTDDLFEHKNSEVSQLSKAYSPQVFRFFVLQAHYRSTLNITDNGLQGAEGALSRLFQAYKLLPSLQGQEQSGTEDEQVLRLLDQAFERIGDDFNTAEAIAKLFALLPKINKAAAGQFALASTTITRLQKDFSALLFDIFGLQEEQEQEEQGAESLDGLMQLIFKLRKDARDKKDYATSDAIREHLQGLGIQVKDSKEGATWLFDKKG